MSEAVFANLPRFDLIGSESSPGQGRRTPSRPSPARAEEIRKEEASAAAEAEMAKRLKAMDATLSSLTQTIDQARQDAEAQTLDTILAIAEKLFPELSRQFLAEEIAQHLPKLLPENAAHIEIRAEPDLVEALREVVQRSNRLSSLCTVAEDEAPGARRVNVSWGAGGLTFDFAALLDSCLAHLRSRQTVREG